MMKREKEQLKSYIDTADINNLFVPASEELELEMISNLIYRPDNMEKVYYHIKPSDFTNEKCKKVYKAMRKMYEKGKVWDLIILQAMFEGQEMTDVIFHIPNSISYAVSQVMIDELKSKAIGRTVFVELYELMRENAESTDRAEIVSQGLNLFSALSQRLSSHEGSKEDTLSKHKILMRRRLSGELIGIPTGFPDLDAMLGQGVQKKDLIIIGARPSVGKTSFSLSTAFNIAKQKKFKVLYFTLEMDDEEVMDRLLAFQTNTPVTSIVRGTVKKEKLKDAYKQIADLPLTIRYMPKASSADIFSVASKEKAQNGLDVVIVDYLGLLEDEADGRRESDVAKIGRITKGLRAVAQMLDVAMIVPHQLNRKIEQRSSKQQETPLLSDLRDSGHIEQDADVIMFLSRNFMGDRAEKAVLRIGKHRTGQTGKIDLRFNPLTTKFESV